jgi:succinate dehydrogenase/fumarate reductase flavoprotein subunit
MPLENFVESDILVIGGGMAGCFAAIKAREQGLNVTIVDKAYVGKTGGTHFSEGDLAVFNPEWGHNFEVWATAINQRGEYINNQEWTRVFLEDSYKRYNDLISFGVTFYQEDGKIWVNRVGFGGPVIPTEHFNMSNRKYAPILRKTALERGIKILDRVMVDELLRQDGKIIGAIGFHTIDGDLYIFSAKAVVVATGGSTLKEVHKPTHFWTSDGDAMAYRAGAEITGKEFKFGPGAAAPRALMKARLATGKKEVTGNIVDIWAKYPAFRGDGMAIKPPANINAEGGPVFSGAWEAHCGRAPVYVDLDSWTQEQMDWMRTYQKRVGSDEPDKIGLDIFKRGKVKYAAGSVYAAQTIHGGAGIWPVNTKCATALPGLYVAGNCCASMVSGAGYAGLGHGLMHAAVTGARAGLGVAEYALKAEKVKPDETEVIRLKKSVIAPTERIGGFSPAWVTQVLQGFTVPYFFLQVKHEERLKAALTLVGFLNNHIVPKLMAKDAHEWRLAVETKNMTLNAEMILRASLFRTESRGTHFREDYPRRDDPKWLAWVMLKEVGGQMKALRKPLTKDWWPDLSKPYEERYLTMFPGEGDN